MKCFVQHYMQDAQNTVQRLLIAIMYHLICRQSDIILSS